MSEAHGLADDERGGTPWWTVLGLIVLTSAVVALTATYVVLSL